MYFMFAPGTMMAKGFSDFFICYEKQLRLYALIWSIFCLQNMSLLNFLVNYYKNGNFTISEVSVRIY